MPRFKLTFEYDGTGFSGWQIQPDTRTVEGVVEQAFTTLYQQNIDLIGQGRTDAGVHAREQVAHSDLPETFSADRVLHAMKGLLPDDVALTGMEQVSANFHARFNAVTREYEYRIHTVPSPLNRHYSWYVPGRPDTGILHECAKLFLGEHDFRNFCIPPDQEEMTTICTIKRSTWQINDTVLLYTIEGNRFLRHMVRRMAGSMIETARGKLTPDDLKQLLTGPEIEKKAHSAPPHGLILSKVSY
jgi:tRNA pseudouridine38-40 synthase